MWPSQTGTKSGAGTLKLPKKDVDGTSCAVDVESRPGAVPQSRRHFLTPAERA